MIGKIMLTALLAATLLAAAAMPLFQARPTSAPTAAPPGYSTVLSVIQTNAEFSRLDHAIKTSGIHGELNGTGPYTIFAPTDAAFNSLTGTKADVVNMDRFNLAYTMEFHATTGRLSLADLKRVTYVMTLNGKGVAVTASGSGVRLDGANITGPAIETGNGIVYPIDSVMVPPLLTM